MNNCAPEDCSLHDGVLLTSDTEEIVPQVELGVNPQVGLPQSHEGSNMQHPRGSQIVQL
jgi:hypothetical protein